MPFPHRYSERLLGRPDDNTVARFDTTERGTKRCALVLGGRSRVNQIEHSLTSSGAGRWLVVKALDANIITEAVMISHTAKVFLVNCKPPE
jgi:hypothetical protein